MNDPLAASAVEIAARVLSRAWSACAVIEAHIARITEINPSINAVVATRFDAARAEARALDALDDAGRRERPLLGVPFTVKEMIAVADMPATFGTEARRERRSASDATVIARLRAAGAVPLGVTNLPEWGMWFESYNRIYGRTNNPWDLRRTPGGSSGGEGAIVGAGGSVFGIGSDIGGSARMPAAFCGVYAHKPTNGLLPLTGHYPVYRSGPDAQVARRAPFVTIGPLTRSARDLMPLLRVMAGPDDVDVNTEPMALGDVDSVQWRGRRVVLLPAPRMAWARRVSVELRAQVERVGELLRARGAVIEAAPPEIFHNTRDLWFAALQSSSARRFDDVLTDAHDNASRARTECGANTDLARASRHGERHQHLLRELTRTALGRGRYSWPALFFAMGARIGGKKESAMRAALAQLDQLGSTFANLVGDAGVLIAPVHPRPAPRHNAPILFPFDFLYTAIFNALRVPATVVPCGWSRRGLPLAVQIAAARGNDHITIAAACALEDSLGAWTPAPVL